MSIATAGHTRVIRESFGKSVPLIRRLLLDAGLSIVEEFDVSSGPYFQLGIARRSCIVLLVDTPALLFEAVALDRAAALFVPVHVVISGDHDTSYVYWANPMSSSGLRPPVPAKGALENLCARVTKALSEPPQAADGALQEQSHRGQSEQKFTDREDQMFNSLDEEIMRDDQETSTPRERWLRYVVVLLVSIALFGSLYVGIRFLE